MKIRRADGDLSNTFISDFILSISLENIIDYAITQQKNKER